MVYTYMKIWHHGYSAKSSTTALITYIQA